MVVKVVANKGVEFKEYIKDGKHRIYFKDSQGQGRPVEIGNYDLIENRFFSDRKFIGPHWDIIDSADGAKALIVLGGERQIFVGPPSSSSSSSKSNASSKFSSRRKGNDTQSRITLGMCINNATNLVAARMENNPVASFPMKNEDVVKSVYDLADLLLAEYKNRYD